MRIPFAALILVSSFLIAAATPVVAQEVLTNDSIIRMVRAGLPEDGCATEISSAKPTLMQQPEM